MPIAPLSVEDGKTRNAVSLSLARGIEVQMCGRSKMCQNGRIELVSD